MNGTTTATGPGAGAPAQPAERQAIFFGLLLAATLVPFFLLPLSARAFPEARSLQDITTWLLFFGAGGHVAASFIFYGDPDVRGFMRANPIRYGLVPAALLVATTLFYGIADPGPKAYFLVAYWIWQTHHFTRQNQGILAFTARADAAPSLVSDRLAVTLTGVAGILAMLPFITPYKSTVLDEYAWQLRATGLGAYVCAWGAFALGELRRADSCTPWARPVRFSVMLFYLPLFLFDGGLGVYMYLIAHGLQYFVFMYFVVATPAQRRRLALSGLVAFTLIGGGLIKLLQTPGPFWGAWQPWAFGASLGIVMSHFVLDAGVWRLSEPFPRKYMSERFAFLKAERG